MKLIPLADNVLVKSAMEEEKTASGIILATATKEKSLVSAVVAVGPGTEENPMTVKVGDKVVVRKLAGQDLNNLFHNRRINAIGAPMFIGLLPSAAAMILCGDIMKEATPVEIGTAMLAILSMRSEFYHVPKGEPEEKPEKGTRKRKNA